MGCGGPTSPRMDCAMKLHTCAEGYFVSVFESVSDLRWMSCYTSLQVLCYSM